MTRSHMTPDRPTIHDIAKKANVSIATISRAINPETRSRVAKETLDSIDALVRKYRFTPNLAAKNLRSTKCKTIGVLVPHIPNLFISDYWSKIISGVSNALMDSDYRFKVVAIKPTAQKWDGYHFRSAEGIDGLIVGYWPTFFSKKMVVDVPCVIISDPDENVRAHCVCADNARGGEIAAQYLYEKGHEKIAVLTGHDWSTDSAERVKAFRGFFHKVGTAIPMDMVFKANYEEDDASKIVEKLILEKKKVTAFFCCNDNMAYGVLRKLKQLGISCPGKVSVIGFDDDSRAQNFDPPLTTVHVPTHDLGRVAAQKLVEFLKGDHARKFFHGSTTLPVSLVERRSAASVR